MEKFKQEIAARDVAERDFQTALSREADLMRQAARWVFGFGTLIRVYTPSPNSPYGSENYVYGEPATGFRFVTQTNYGAIVTAGAQEESFGDPIHNSRSVAYRFNFNGQVHTLYPSNGRVGASGKTISPRGYENLLADPGHYSHEFPQLAAPDQQ